MVRPLWMIGLRFVGQFPIPAARAQLRRSGKMGAAEVQSAATFTTVGFSAADVGQPAINFRVTARMVTERRHAVADVAVPVFVKAD